MAADQSNIKVNVKVQHQPDQSQKDQNHFSYVIVIENHSETNWQLMSRHWEIQEETGRIFIIDGDGVVGQQPMIKSGEQYTYDSFTTIQSTSGFMSGYYVMSDTQGNKIHVPIAPFQLSCQQERIIH